MVEKMRTAHNDILALGKFVEGMSNSQMKIYSSCMEHFQTMDTYAPYLRSRVLELDSLVVCTDLLFYQAHVPSACFLVCC